MTDAQLPLLLGESPSKNGDRYYHFPLSGAVGRKMCELAGIEPESEGTHYGRYYWALRDAFDCVNLIERYQGPKFDRTHGIAGYADLKEEGILENRHIVCLGRNVASVMETCANVIGDLEFFTWRWSEDLGSAIVIVPHPSALNRLYIDDGIRQEAGRILREAIHEAHVCSSTQA